MAATDPGEQPSWKLTAEHGNTDGTWTQRWRTPDGHVHEEPQVARRARTSTPPR